MSMDAMSFILGGILIAAALFGGGLEVKELKLPQIGTVARILAALVGIGFVGLAVTLRSPELIAKLGHEPPAKVTEVFEKPMQGDLRLDVCRRWADDCGEPAATAWCQSKGFSRATDFPQENVGEKGLATRVIATGQICKEAMCTAFARVTCEK